MNNKPINTSNYVSMRYFRPLTTFLQFRGHYLIKMLYIRDKNDIVEETIFIEISTNINFNGNDMSKYEMPIKDDYNQQNINYFWYVIFYFFLKYIL